MVSAPVLGKDSGEVTPGLSESSPIFLFSRDSGSCLLLPSVAGSKVGLLHWKGVSVFRFEEYRGF